MKPLAKDFFRAFFLVLAWPLAVVSLFGRVDGFYSFGAQLCALVPGLPGNYLRIAYYRLTLAECASSSRIEFGSFFAHSAARVGPQVYIGPYCVLGLTTIGARTQIAAGVQILSGRHQHSREAEGRLESANEANFERVEIGADCWIGAAAVVMAPVGQGSTIGAGSVVTKAIPAGVVAVGSPARVLPPK